MPDLLQIHQMGSKGLNTDVEPWELPGEFVNNGSNFRVFAGALVSSGGSQLWSASPVNFDPGHILHVKTPSSDYWLVPGRTGVYAFDGANWTDISSAEGYPSIGFTDELLWTSAQLGQIPIINNPQAQPEYWSPQSPSQIMQPLPFSPGVTWADKGFTASIIRSHRNFLFALNLHEGAGDFPDSYRWSHPADINGIPFTWDETDQSALAGKASLGGNGGIILDGRSLRDAFCIYSQDGIDILDFTGDEFVWRRRELSSTIGVLTRECIVEVKGTHFFLADGDIVKNDGNTIDSIAHNRIRKQLSAQISHENYRNSYVVRHDVRKEIWFCIPEEGELFPTIAFIYNWKDDAWTTRDLPDNIAYSSYGTQIVASKRWDDFADTETWDATSLAWSSETTSPLDETIIGINPVDSSIHILDPREVPDDDIQTILERTDYPLIDTRIVTTIVRVYPQIEGTADISIEFGSQNYPGAPVRWKPAVIFNPSVDRKIDVRTTGELHAWRIRSLGQGIFHLSGMNIEYEVSGVR